MIIVHFADGRPPWTMLELGMTSPRGDTVAEIADDFCTNLDALLAEGAALAAAPEPWNLDVDECLGPTVEVTPFRPFEGLSERDTQVWAVVDRQAVAPRLVEPAPIVDPALINRDESTAQ